MKWTSLVGLLTVFFLLIPKSSHADLTFAEGVGKNLLKGEVPFERTLQLGYQFPKGDFFFRPEVGWFNDQGENSFWLAPMVGVRTLSLFGLELHLAAGPTYLDRPDSVLGGHFQFSLEGGLGLTDGVTYIGLAWKHMSSAGIEMPNLGRDFICLQVRIL